MIVLSLSCCTERYGSLVATDEPYGPDARNVFDLWVPNTKQLAPLLVVFHGGGFVSGDKSEVDDYLVDRCLHAGIAVAACNYRYATDAPFLAPMTDCARAIQYLRQNADRWGLDPGRIAAFGDSAGGAIALWIAYNDELADPESADPVLRESTALSAVVAFDAPCSLDPSYIRELLGGRAYESPSLPALYGITPEQLDDAELAPYYAFASPINHVTEGDPPTFLYYNEPNEPLSADPNPGDTIYYEGYGQTLPRQPDPGEGMHHPGFGVALAAALDAVGVENTLLLREDFPEDAVAVEEVVNELLDFLVNHTTSASTRPRDAKSGATPEPI